MTRSPRYWADNGMICSLFGEPFSPDEAAAQLDAAAWLALNDPIRPQAYEARWLDLVRAIRDARAQSTTEQRSAA